jgi:hypothetical protein
MAAAEDLMSAGLPAGLAKRIGLEVPITGLVATGATQGTALVLASNFSIFGTVAANTGCIVSGDKDSVVYNGGASPLTVYPPLGFNFSGLAANVGIAVPANKGALFIPARNSTIAAIISA